MTNVTPPLPEAQAGKSSSEVYLDRWLKERELDRSWGVFQPLPGGFVADAIPSFKICTYDEEGRLRPELSRTRHDRQVDKYLSPTGIGSVAFAPRPNSFALFEASTEKWIAEGEGKALALAALDLPVLGVGGCHNWHLSEQTNILPGIASRIHAGDIVNVAMDGDWQTNPEVAKGTGKLLHEILRLGATPRLRVLPPGKGGIDDYIAILRREGRNVLDELAKLPSLRTIPIPGDIPTTHYDEIIARPPPKWIIKNLIPPGELTAIVGEPSCGKTFLTLDILFSVARSLPHYHDPRFKIKRGGAVVHITLEGTALGNRVNAYRKHHSIRESLPYIAIETPISLRDPETADQLIRSITHAANGRDVVLIAVDTVNRAMGGGDENSSADMGSLLSSAERLKSAFPGCGILLVHHFGKDTSKGARGHSSFRGSVGAELEVLVDKQGIRTVKLGKQREGSTDITFNFNLGIVGLGYDEDGDEVTSCFVQPCDAPTTEDAGAGEMYDWIYEWYAGPNNRAPVTKRRVVDQASAIKPKGVRAKAKDLEDALLWGVDMKLAALSEKQPNRGEAYDLRPRKQPKY